MNMRGKPRKYKPDEWVAMLGLALMLCVTFISILSRYVLPVAWAFTEELVCAVFILVSLLGAGIAIKDGKAMSISMVTDLLPIKFHKYIALIQMFATFAFAVILFWYGVSMVRSEMNMGMRTAALNWPEAVFGSFIPIGAACIAAASLQFGYGVWKKSDKSKEERK
jgi:TRAP-type C4-dicarboxylate transport system permease small subunit